MKKLLTCLGLLCLGVVAGVAVGPMPAGAAGERHAVAVLPLHNEGDAAQEFLADGLTDEIAATLSAVPGLDVVARSSVFRFKQPDRDLKAVAVALHAGYLVDGTVRMTGARVVVRVRLTENQNVVWMAEFDSTVPGLFDVEDQIARKIAASLKVETPERLVRNRTTDAETYLEFLAAKAAARPRGAAAVAAAATHLERAIARDADFAAPTALLAYGYALTPLYAPSLRSGSPAEERRIVERTIPRSDMLARRATQLDPDNADGFVALAYAEMVQRHMLAAEDAFRRALALNPNQADGLHGYSQLLAAFGRIDESLAMRGHLEDIEQFITNYTADTAEIVWLAGDTDKAVAMLQPFRPARTLELTLVQAAAGRYREAAAALREMPATNYPAGMLEAAAKILESAPTVAADPANLARIGNLSFAYMHVGAPERVLEFYEDEVSADYFQPISATWFWHPTYAAVRKTARFRKVAADLGLVDYWRARGWPAQCRAGEGSDFSCD